MSKDEQPNEVVWDDPFATVSVGRPAYASFYGFNSSGVRELPAVDQWVENDLRKVAELILAAEKLGLLDVTLTSLPLAKSDTLPLGAKYNLVAKKLTEGSRALRSTRTA